MRLRGHREIDLERTLYAKRTMAFGDTVLAVGAVVPWRELKLPERTVRLLHDQRRIGHERPGERNGTETPPNPYAKRPANAVVTAPPRPPVQPQPSKQQRR